MGQSEYTDSFMRTMLNWVRWLGNQVSGVFQSGTNSGGGTFNWFASNWLKILLVLIVLGIVVDWVIWMVRWRPYWLWFRKKRVLLDAEHQAEDLDAHDHDKLMEYGAYDDFDELDEDTAAPRFKSRALSRQRDEENEDGFDDVSGTNDPFADDDDFDEDDWDDEPEDDSDDLDDVFEEDDESAYAQDDEGDEDEEDEIEDRPGLAERFRGLLGGMGRRASLDDEEDDEDWDDEEFFDEDDEDFFDEGSNLPFYADETKREEAPDLSVSSFNEPASWNPFGDDEESTTRSNIRSIYQRPAETNLSSRELLSFEKGSVEEEADGKFEHSDLSDAPHLSRKARRRMKENETGSDE